MAEDRFCGLWVARDFLRSLVPSSDTEELKREASVCAFVLTFPATWLRLWCL